MVPRDTVCSYSIIVPIRINMVVLMMIVMFFEFLSTQPFLHIGRLALGIVTA